MASINDVRLSSEWETKFRQDALVRTTYYNAHMDGNDLPYAAAEKIVVEDPGRDESAEEVAKRIGIVGKEKDIQTVMNYCNAARFVDQLSRLGRKTGVPFSEKESLQIHSLLMEKILPSHQLGVYRITPVKGGLLPVEIPYQAEDLWLWLKNTKSADVHPILKAGIVLAEIMRIMPFVEGSGGVARLMSRLVLSVTGYNEREYVSWEEYLGKDPDRLHEPDLTFFLEYFCGALAGEVTRLKERVKRLALENVGLLGVDKRITLTERQAALMQEIEMKDELTMSDARRVLPMVSDDTILRDLTALVEKKMIKKKGKTKGSRYVVKK